MCVYRVFLSNSFSNLFYMFLGVPLYYVLFHIHVCCLRYAACRPILGCYSLVFSRSDFVLSTYVAYIYELLPLQHVNLYILFIWNLLRGSFIVCNLLNRVLLVVAWFAMFRLVCLNMLVIFLFNGLWYVKLIHVFSCVYMLCSFCCLKHKYDEKHNLTGVNNGIRMYTNILVWPCGRRKKMGPTKPVCV
jgi:hypothetical protein